VPLFKIVSGAISSELALPFLLTFHGNYGSILYHFWDRRRFQYKIANFSHPRKFCAPTERVPLGIEYRHLVSKTKITGLPAERYIWRYLQPSGYNAQTWWTNVCPSRRRTPDDSKDSAIASRGKNNVSFCTRTIIPGYGIIPMWIWLNKSAELECGIVPKQTRQLVSTYSEKIFSPTPGGGGTCPRAH